MVVFHVGYHKTASTWLRRAVFPSWSGIAFQHRNEGLTAAWVRHLVASPDEDFLAGAMRTTLAAVAERAGRQVVVSNEDLSGALFGGGRAGFRHAERLHRVAPDARILAVIRRQDDMARSIYAQYVNLGGHRSLGRFLAGEAERCPFDASDLAYDELLEHYRTLFGPQRVTIVPYELLRADPPAFLRRVGAACGLSAPAMVPPGAANVSLSRYPTLALRGWNRAFRRSALNPRPAVVAVPGASWPRRLLQDRVEPRLPGVLRRGATPADRALLGSFAARFAASNARTADLSGWDLGAFGYALPEGPAAA